MSHANPSTKLGVSAMSLKENPEKNNPADINLSRVKEDLRLKLHPCFYDILLLILWRNNFLQSFVTFWSVLTKLWSCKVWIWRKWRHTRECTKHFILGFHPFYVFLWNLQEFNPFLKKHIFGFNTMFSGTTLFSMLWF